jgi:hypothetical protein
LSREQDASRSENRDTEAALAAREGEPRRHDIAAPREAEEVAEEQSLHPAEGSLPMESRTVLSQQAWQSGQ